MRGEVPEGGALESEALPLLFPLPLPPPAARGEGERGAVALPPVAEGDARKGREGEGKRVRVPKG